jgi:hypothetical protein
VKLRIRGSSIRLRLSKTEVDALRERGVEETLALAPMSLVYRIELAPGSASVTAAFDGRKLVVRVPEAVAVDFCDTDRVGFEETHDGVRILVEKDWQCLAPRDEDESDAFPHPAAKPES